MQSITCSIDAAAASLGMCRASIYNLIRDNKIEAVKVGRRRLVKIDSIRKLVEAA
jgi:excisionase family DNA binding protein